tara:strand:+ start:321 stop:569 length:249 start_codon:yes stop_codon:yes gene_type:complete
MSDFKITPEELQTMLDRSARRALESVGLTDENAAKDISEIRSLLSAWRDTRKSIWITVTRVITTAVLLFIAGAVWMSFKDKL